MGSTTKQITLPGGITISTKYDALLNLTAIISKYISQKILLEQSKQYVKQSELIKKAWVAILMNTNITANNNSPKSKKMAVL